MEPRELSFGGICRRRRLNSLILVATLSISGCSGLDPVRFADGNPGYRASCPGFGDDYSRCYQQAAEICGSTGYDLMTRDGSTNYNKMLREGYSAQGAEYRLLYGSVHFRRVYLRCRTVVSLGGP